VLIAVKRKKGGYSDKNREAYFVDASLDNEIELLPLTEMDAEN